MNNGKASCALTVYTPIWDDDGEHFKAWIEIGSAWRDEHGKIKRHIQYRPLPEENFTGVLCDIAVGAPPPAPLTVTEDEFLEAHLARE